MFGQKRKSFSISSIGNWKPFPDILLYHYPNTGYDSQMSYYLILKAIMKLKVLEEAKLGTFEEFECLNTVQAAFTCQISEYKAFLK